MHSCYCRSRSFCVYVKLSQVASLNGAASKIVIHNRSKTSSIDKTLSLRKNISLSEMATPQQVTELLTMLQTQNQQMLTLIQQQQPNQANNNRTKKPDRLVINAGLDDREWAFF